MTNNPGSRWTAVFLIWLMMLVAYMDRVNISVAGPSITGELHLSKTQFGFVLAAFSIGYALLQIPGGSLSDRFGSKPLLIIGLIGWSVLTGITGLCAAFATLVAVRFCFGMGEGLENGAQFKVIGDNFSPKERSRANGFFLSALAIGPAIASPASTFLIQHLGWRAMFFCYAGLGIAVALIIGIFMPPEPKTKGAGGNLFQALGSPRALKLTLTYFLFNVAFWGFVGWIPTYLKEQRHVSLANLGWLGSIPYVAGACGILIAGALGSRAIERRKVVASVAYVIGAAGLALALLANSLPLTILSLSIASCALYSSFAPFWSIVIDAAGASKRGAFTGAINFGGQLGGFCGQLLIGLIADRTGSFVGVLILMAAVLVGSAVVVLTTEGSGDQQTLKLSDSL